AAEPRGGRVGVRSAIDHTDYNARPVDTLRVMSDGPSAPRPELSGGDLLARLSDDMVRAKKQFFGKGPEQAKSYMFDDLLIVVMRGGLTTAEQTMLRFGRQ